MSKEILKQHYLQLRDIKLTVWLVFRISFGAWSLLGWLQKETKLPLQKLFKIQGVFHTTSSIWICYECVLQVCYIHSQIVSDKIAKIPSLTLIQGALSNQRSIVSPVWSLPYAEEPGGGWPADQGGWPPQLGHGGQVQEVPLVQPGPWLPPLHHHGDGSHEQQQHLHCLAICEELDFCLDCGFHKFRVISVALLIFYCLSTAAHKTVISGPGCDNTHLEPSFRFFFDFLFFTCSGTFCSSVVYGQTWMSLFERQSNCLTKVIDSTIIFFPRHKSSFSVVPHKEV